MTKLFIIGNGFDLHFGVPTKVSNFRYFLSQQNSYPIGNARDSYLDLDVDW